MIRPLLRLPPMLALVLALAGCAFGAPQSVTDRDTRAACRQQAEAQYRLRHRDDIYAISNQGAPSSGAVGVTLPTAGLADRFEQENMVETCVHNTGTGTALRP